MNEKPKLRGHFHQAAFFAALGACSVLLSHSSNLKAFTALFVYSISLCGMCAASALYHRLNWQPVARARMRRLDHAFIFIMIGGTSTPLCWLGMGDATGIRLLEFIWVAVAAGVIQSLLASHRIKWVSVILYLAVSFMSLPYFPELERSLGPLNLSLLVAGGVAYVVGAVIYALKRPNPWRGYLGYHEVFHLLVIVAAIFHFIVIDRIVM